jgi:hypothetical protein
MRKHRFLACLAPLLLAACGNAAAGPTVDTCSADVVPTATARCGLVINEVAAAGAPDDWFEVINTGGAPIDLSDFVYVDTPGALDRARSFPAFVLRPGDRHVQYVSKPVAGFKLGSGEALYVYRGEDGALIDHVDWAEGDAPRAGSFARMPDALGAFRTRARDTQGGPNS